MVKPKTKEQKKQDNDHLQKKYKRMASANSEFLEDFYQSEYNINWVRIGIISEIIEATQCVQGAEERIKEEYTFTDYETDSSHEQWKNTTHVDRYKK
jgi:putative NADH-flavin reductase|tara:strand:+ start:1361 stop:1651 length:291 start_codon:yes stop_codon:yes gene_type:complete